MSALDDIRRAGEAALQSGVIGLASAWNQLTDSPDESREMLARLLIEVGRLMALPDAAPLRRLIWHQEFRNSPELEQQIRNKTASLVERRGSDELKEISRRGFDPQESGT